jgi:Uma2 family endonuclease
MVLEVAVTSHVVDRGIKALLYAAAAIPEYWLLDVPAGTLEVRREPVGGVYRSTRVLDGQDTVQPLQVPVGPVRVSELLGS